MNESTLAFRWLWFHKIPKNSSLKLFSISPLPSRVSPITPHKQTKKTSPYKTKINLRNKFLEVFHKFPFTLPSEVCETQRCNSFTFVPNPNKRHFMAFLIRFVPFVSNHDLMAFCCPHFNFLKLLKDEKSDNEISFECDSSWQVEFHGGQRKRIMKFDLGVISSLSIVYVF